MYEPHIATGLNQNSEQMDALDLCGLHSWQNEFIPGWILSGCLLIILHFALCQKLNCELHVWIKNIAHWSYRWGERVWKVRGGGVQGKGDDVQGEGEGVRGNVIKILLRNV